MEQRIIHLSGIVVDSRTLQPIDSVIISDENGNRLGATDKAGYYEVKIKNIDKGSIKFQIELKKDGFVSFRQRENWGDLKGDTRLVLYFGLKSSVSDVAGFSEFYSGKLNNGYKNVLEGFSEVKNKKSFENALKAAKENNENVFFNIAGMAFIVSDTGWIKLYSETDAISINGKKIVKANMLNNILKRSSIKKMTPVNGNNQYNFYIEAN
ncbi:hypothetical protein ACTJKC_07475 [Pedobacter sp. 22226]|uniref:hypothetical protein n=1 Tax=Pedobacter sp. 22226 TaxID=3453894 RepID=UPI003F824770